MRELIDLIDVRNALLELQAGHSYAALSTVSHANTEIFNQANQVRGKVMDFALFEVISHWKG